MYGPRAQIDRDLYAANMRKTIKTSFPDKLQVHLGSVVDLLIEGGACRGVLLEGGERLRADRVVITTGTFLGGRCYIGQDSIQAGRYLRNEEGVEAASNALAASLRKL